MGLGDSPVSRLQGPTEAPTVGVPAFRRAPASWKIPAGPSQNRPVSPQRSPYSICFRTRRHDPLEVISVLGCISKHFALLGKATATAQKGNRFNLPTSEGGGKRVRGGSGRPLPRPLQRPPRVQRFSPKAPQVPFGPPQTVLPVKSIHIHPLVSPNWGSC